MCTPQVPVWIRERLPVDLRIVSDFERINSTASVQKVVLHNTEKHALVYQDIGILRAPAWFLPFIFDRLAEGVRPMG